MATVRDATFEVLRRFGLTRIFANPGSTEIALFTDLPDDLEFVLGLHEGSVVGMATGLALAEDRPVLVVLHTTAGLGNAVGALATARTNRAPLVVVVGQQDRRHLALEPFLTGRLEGLAGSYPVWTHQPSRAQDVPGAVARAWHEARDGRGPAIVVVPQGDWLEPYDDAGTLAAPDTLLARQAAEPHAVAALAELVGAAVRPALVVGAGADSAEGWRSTVALAEVLGCPVWQEAFGARAGFPQDHPQFAGHLPAARGALAKTLSGHDLVLVVGAPAFRQYPYEAGVLVEAGTTIAVVTREPDEAHRSPAALVVLAEPAPVVAALAEAVAAGGVRSHASTGSPQTAPPAGSARLAEAPARPNAAAGMTAVDVLAELGRRLPPETVVVEETPSSRADLNRLLPARAPLGFLSAAMGGLGFGLPAAVGVRMAARPRPVVAVLGDGSSLYGVHALWSAAHYGVGVLFVVLSNGRYAIMDQLAADTGNGKAPWPAFDQVSVAALAGGFGCPARRVDTYGELVAALDEVVPTLAGRSEPLLLDVAVQPEPRS